MPYELKNYNKLTLAIHSTDDSFGFAYRENNSSLTERDCSSFCGTIATS